MSFELENKRSPRRATQRANFGSVGTDVLNGIDLNESARNFFDGKARKYRRNNLAGTSVGSREQGRQAKVTPFTEAQILKSRMMKAQELRELGKCTLAMTVVDKLSKIKVENEKILRELQDISCGKRLKVGHHQVHPNLNRPKTLHFDKLKREAEKIDADNTKILEAILNAKPIVPITSDRRFGHEQEKLLKNISKCARMNFHPIIKRRRELLEQRKMALPSILDYSTDGAGEKSDTGGRKHFRSHISGSDSSPHDSKPSVSPRAKRIYSVPRSVKHTLQPVSHKEQAATNLGSTATS